MKSLRNSIFISLFFLILTSRFAAADFSPTKITDTEVSASRDWETCRQYSSQGLLSGPWYPATQGVPQWANENPIPEICKPDTLYVWGSSTLLNFFKKNAPLSGPWDKIFPTPVFFHVNPISTFAYGTLSVRVKLKKTVQYWINTGTQFDDHPKICQVMEKLGRAKNTVLILPWLNFRTAGTDYIICSSEVIESWSFGSPEHLQEMQKSYEWIQTQPQSKWITYLTSASAFSKPDPVLPLMFDMFGEGKPGVDSKDWSKKHLETNLEAMKTFVGRGTPVIAVNPESPEANSQIFESRRQSYWNTKP